MRQCWAVFSAGLVVPGGGGRRHAQAGGVFCLDQPACAGRAGAGRRADLAAVPPQRLVQSLCALLLLGLAQLAAAQWPLVAADDDQRGLFRWAYHLTNINALSEFANRLWPWAALACVLLSISRQLRRERW